MKQVITKMLKSVNKLFLACCVLSLIAINAVAQSPCNAHFTFRNDSVNVNTVLLTSSANPSGSKFSWSFGDGTYSTSVNPAHQYLKGGKYLVCLKIENPYVPCQDLICDTITVGNGGSFPICDAHFQHYALNTNPDSVHFYATTGNSINRKYSWSFGDGTGSDNSNPWHFYLNSGTYYVCLTVTDSTSAGKCSNTWCDSVKVNALPKPICDAHFQHYAAGNMMDSIHFYSGTHTSTTKYLWNFGDGGTSHDPNPWHKYVPGNYLACLTITDSTSGGSCTATWCDSIHINGTMGTCNAHFTFKQDSVNTLYTVRYFSGANPMGTKYNWNFGDGTSSTSPNPIHTYAHGGYYLVCLKVENPYVPCQDLFCDSIYVQGTSKPVCNAHFQHYSLNNNPDSVHFYSMATSASTKYSWSFGDGTGSTASNPWHYYVNPGTYYVCLTVSDSTSGGKCTETWCDTIKVGTNIIPCDAHFKAFYIFNSTFTVHFESAPNPVGTLYYWNFGDGSGNTSAGPNPNHTFPHDGTYYVCLTVYNTAIACSQTWCDSIHIKGLPKPNCNAKFVRYSSYANRDSVHFYVSPPNSSTAKYAWTFGDGGTSSASSPWHLYPGPGVYYACLTVTDSTSGGTCSATWCDSVRIEKPLPPLCDAHFKYYKKSTNADSVKFYPVSTNNSTSKKYSWSFGDGSSSKDIYPWHFYANPGTYYVCLTVTDSTKGGSCTATWCDSVKVGAPMIPCNAHFTRFSTNSTNTSIHFIPALNPPGTKYSWNFGDGGTSDKMDPTHLYANYGTYYVCLTVNDSAGNCHSTWCDSIKVGVAPIPCNAHFKYQAAYYFNTIYFVHAPNPPGTKYTWDFGDGQSSTAGNPVHQYANGGTYLVCLTVNDSIGNCHSTWCDSIKVGGFNANVCNSNFYFKPGNVLHSLYFFSSPNPPATKYLWNFGDGTTSTLPNPFHQYANAGTYKVCLTTTDSVAGCSDTRCLTIGPLRMAQGGSTIEDGQGGIAVSIYPNPMTERGVIHIENTNGAVVFRVFDNMGKLVIAMSNLTNGEFEFSKQELRSGLYLYEVVDADNNVSRGKLIIQ